MSVRASQSPLPGPTVTIDETRLPKGQCRYILLNPEIKGQRCACVCFTLNRTLPSVTCECGHQSCYHIKEPEAHVDAAQTEQLRHRIKRLEDELDREQSGTLGSTLAGILNRLGGLEEQFERTRDEVGHEIKGVYGQIKRMWQSVDLGEKKQMEFDHKVLGLFRRFAELDDTLAHLDERVRQCDENTIDLEDRLDCLEEVEDPPRGQQGNTEQPGAPNSKSSKGTSSETDFLDTNALPIDEKASEPASALDLSHSASGRSDLSDNAAGSWTVHISLLPTTAQPFPFEKDTTAYKRCLSRGLHRMVPVRGNESDDFARAVEKAFGNLLRGRPWVPLQARLCDAESLLGLPMLRPLDPKLVNASNYNQDFLRQHCAVCGPNGRIDSLYIAMESDHLSWHFIRRAPCVKEDLEESWQYDRLLDPKDPVDDDDDSMDEDDRPSAGDIVPPLQLSLKRPAADISRTPSFSAGSSADAISNRPKVSRTSCVTAPVEIRRRVETV